MHPSSTARVPGTIAATKEYAPSGINIVMNIKTINGLAYSPTKLKGIFYLLFLVPILGALNLIFPPFHAPDDYDHVKRAYSVASGSLWPKTELGRSSGGYIDARLAEFIEASKPIVHWHIPHDGSTTYKATKPARPWSTSEIYSEFPGSASYLPILYAPQAATIWMGRNIFLSIESTVLISRFINGFIAVIIIAYCLTRLPCGTAIILLVLILPKSLLQFASNSLDPLLHALTLYVIYWFVRARTEHSQLHPRHFLLVAFCLLAAGGARPPLLALAALPLWIAWRQRSLAGSLLVISAAVAVCAWFATVMPLIVDLRCGPTGTLGSKAATFAFQAPQLIGNSLLLKWRYYYGSFVGELGWGNGPAGIFEQLPTWIYVAAGLMLVFALAQDMTATLSLTLPDRALLLSTSLIISLGVFFSMYLVCTKPDSSWIGGVQGRYFVTPALICGIAFAGLLHFPRFPRRVYPVCLYLFLSAGFATLVYEGIRLY
jgi:uncharacterized membrane protein